MSRKSTRTTKKKQEKFDPYQELIQLLHGLPFNTPEMIASIREHYRIFLPSMTDAIRNLIRNTVDSGTFPKIAGKRANNTFGNTDDKGGIGKNAESLWQTRINSQDESYISYKVPNRMKKKIGKKIGEDFIKVNDLAIPPVTVFESFKFSCISDVLPNIIQLTTFGKLLFPYEEISFADFNDKLVQNGGLGKVFTMLVEYFSNNTFSVYTIYFPELMTLLSKLERHHHKGHEEIWLSSEDGTCLVKYLSGGKEKATDETSQINTFQRGIYVNQKLIEVAGVPIIQGEKF